MNYDVIVIGAGPTGLMMGCLLKTHGLSCCIIEKKSSICPETKAVILHSASIEIFETIGLLDNISGCSSIGKYLAFYYNKIKKLELDFTQIASDTKYPYFLLVKQPDIENILEQKFISLGGQVRRNNELVNIIDLGKIVVCTTRCNKVDMIYNADFVIGCDGASSSIRKLLKLPFTGSTLEFDYIIEEGQTSLAYPEAEISMHISDNAVVSFLPLPDRIIRIGGPGSFMKFDNTRDQESLKASFKNMLNSFETGFDMHIDKYTHIAKYSVHERLAESFQVNRIFIAGDAAHLHTPAGGQAMNTGFQDVWNLAWKIAFVKSKKNDISFLQTYEIERKAIAQEVIRTANFFSLIQQIKTSSSEAERESLINSSKTLVKKLSQIYMNYGSSSLIDKQEPFQLLTKLPKSTNLLSPLSYLTYNIVCHKRYINSFSDTDTKMGQINICTLDDNDNSLVNEYLLVRPDGYIEKKLPISNLLKGI